MGKLEESELEQRTIESETAMQRRKAIISGKALNRIGIEVREMSESLAEISKKNIERNETDRSAYNVTEKLFKELYEHTQTVYMLILGTRGLYSSRPESNMVSAGTGLTVNIELLVEPAPPIKDDEYPILAEEEPRKELNRLSIINAIYNAVFASLINHVTTAYMNAEMIKNSKPKQGMIKSDPNNFMNLRNATFALEEAVSEGRLLLTEGRSKTEEANLAEVIYSAAKVARLHYIYSGTQLEVDEIPQDVRVKGKEDEIRRALLNILLDKPYVLRRVPQRKVYICYGKYGDNAVLIVRDNGPNIPHQPEDLIFQIAARNAVAENRVADISSAESSIHGYGGELHARNVVGGVEMTIQLPTLH
ncbi:HAMP domain-containing histidine kinase [Candidatus Woesearchaeota archaeon]|nr:HAMP domain-containing histidine kinase [Candidatus Woesearchaeota archaeon]